MNLFDFSNHSLSMVPPGPGIGPPSRDDDVPVSPQRSPALNRIAPYLAPLGPGDMLEAGRVSGPDGRLPRG
jgi:hypothetical protein